MADRITRKHSVRVQKYCLFKFNVDGLTAIFTSSTLFGEIISVGEQCQVFYKGELLDGEILAMAGKQTLLLN